MAKLITFILMFALLALNAGNAAVNKKVARKNKNLKQIENQIYSQKKKISRLKKELEGLENKLGSSNKRYLKNLERKKRVEIHLDIAQKNLNESKTKITERTEVVSKIIESIVVNSLKQDDSGAAQMLSKKILIKALTGELKSLNAARTEVSGLQDNLNTLRKKYQEYSSTETELLAVMREWENSKRSKALLYIDEMKRGDKLKGKFKSLKKQKISSKLISKMKSSIGSFMTPINEYIDLEYGKKGVTYKFRGRKPVRNGRVGKIDYSGKLSTYGNVVMVDHGNQTRSIFLGQFVPKVKKGAMVQVGAILGYTTGSMEQVGKIYFEVRKRNKVQNTIYLMDEKSLAKAKLVSDNS